MKTSLRIRLGVLLVLAANLAVVFLGPGALALRR